MRGKHLQIEYFRIHFHQIDCEKSVSASLKTSAPK